MPRPFRILFCGYGNQLALIDAFAATARRMGTRLESWVADSGEPELAAVFGKRHVAVPSERSSAYAGAVLAACRRLGIDAVTACGEAQLRLAGEAERRRFEAAGIRLRLPGRSGLELIQDGRALARFARKNGIASARIIESARGRIGFPVHVYPEPRFGQRVFLAAKTREDVAYYLRHPERPVLYSLPASHSEFVADVFVDADGRAREIVTKSKRKNKLTNLYMSTTRRNPRVAEAARRLLEALPGAYGPYQSHWLIDPRGRPLFRNVDAGISERYLASVEAGAPFLERILADLFARPQPPRRAWRAGVYTQIYAKPTFFGIAAGSKLT